MEDLPGQPTPEARNAPPSETPAGPTEPTSFRDPTIPTHSTMNVKRVRLSKPTPLRHQTFKILLDEDKNPRRVVECTGLWQASDHPQGSDDLAEGAFPFGVESTKRPIDEHVPKPHDDNVIRRVHRSASPRCGRELRGRERREGRTRLRDRQKGKQKSVAKKKTSAKMDVKPSTLPPSSSFSTSSAPFCATPGFFSQGIGNRRVGITNLAFDPVFFRKYIFAFPFSFLI